MEKYIHIELIIDEKTIAWSRYKITSKSTIKSLLKRLKEFLEETKD